jgi:hypothetical protein
LRCMKMKRNICIAGPTMGTHLRDALRTMIKLVCRLEK